MSNAIVAMTIRACVLGLTQGSADANPDNQYISLLSKLADELERGEDAFSHPGAQRNPTELEMYRADHEAIRVEGFDSPSELLDAWKKARLKLASMEQPWTDAQIERSWRNSPQLHADAKSFAAYERIVMAVEYMRGIRNE
jgi:hypothetical protein